MAELIKKATDSMYTGRDSDDLLMKYFLSDNQQALKELEKINALDFEEDLSPEDIDDGLKTLDNLRTQVKNVKDLKSLSEEEQNKLMEIINGRMDMLEMRIQDYADKRFGEQYSDVDKKYYQESDVGGEESMPNYRGLMGNRDEDGSLKPMPGKEPRR